MRRLLALLATAAVLGGSAAACSGPSEAEESLDAFVSGWHEGDLSGVSFITPDGTPVPSGEATAEMAALTGDLTAPPEVTRDSFDESDGSATAHLTVAWPLPGGATWTHVTRVRLLAHDNGWPVVWEPSVVHPELVEGDELLLRRLVATRGNILDGAAQPLFTAREVVQVGVVPREIENVDLLAADLDAAFATLGHDLDVPGWLPDDVAAAEPDHFVEVVTLRRDEYDQIRDRIRPLPGTRFREGERHLAPSRTFARALLGTVRPVLAEDLDNHPGVYDNGDVIGAGGLSGAYEEQLRGVVGQAVVIARTAPDGTVSDVELDRVEPVAGTDLRTTLDPAVQEAAEAALSAEERPAALVAIRVSDGAVQAVANTAGDDFHPDNIALTGSVPPGSTFKMVVGYGLLEAGEVGLTDPVPCPDEYAAGGITIGNDFDGDRGDIPFREAVAISCNTAFAQLGPRLGDDGLRAAGAALGIGGDWDLGLPTFTGEVSPGGSDAERALAAFGQGQTVVSPAAMAAATAAVARGAWLPPTLVVDPEAAAPAPEPLPGAVVSDLHAALRAVVTDGTARALADVPGGDVYGKTGSAEVGEEITHGWFVGWQGDLALAVFVDDGQSGSGAAVPLAEDFLRTLAG